VEEVAPRSTLHTTSTDARPLRRAVLDTSVLFAPGLRADLQELAFQSVFTAIWSPWIIAELDRVLVWQWITERTHGDLSSKNQHACSQAAKRMMTLLLSAFEVINPRPPYPTAWDTLTDADDHPIWAAAVEGGAQYVVSDNTHDFPPPQPDGRCVFQGIEYIPGSAFLDLLLADLADGAADE
jgi:predicted nucleic acid-binding protein